MMTDRQSPNFLHSPGVPLLLAVTDCNTFVDPADAQLKQESKTGQIPTKIRKETEMQNGLVTG